MPTSQEPDFDWGIDGATGYRITQDARLAYRGGRKLLSLVIAALALLIVAILLITWLH